MGVFKFLKNTGAAILGTDSHKADTIKNYIIEVLARQKHEIKNLTVAYDDGLTTLCGECDTMKIKEKAILIAGNIEDVDRVNADGLTAPAPVAQTPAPAPTPAQPQPTASRSAEAPTPTAAPTSAPAAPTPTVAPTAVPTDAPVTQQADESQFYTIQRGDTLSKIAKQFYGNANKYMYIVEENTGVIQDPDKIYAGQVIRIPPLKG